MFGSGALWRSKEERDAEVEWMRKAFPVSMRNFKYTPKGNRNAG